MNFATLIETCGDSASWRDTDTKQWEGQDFVPAAEGSVPWVLGQKIEQSETPHITLVNGRFHAALSDLSGLPEETLQSDGTNHTLTFAGQTCLIGSPVTLYHVTTEQTTPAYTLTHLRIVLGRNCRVNLVEHFLDSAAAAPVIRTLSREVELGTRAKITHTLLVPALVPHLGTTKIIVPDSAFYDAFVLLRNASLTREFFDIALSGLESRCSVNGIMALSGTGYGQILTSIAHQALQTTSRQLIKSVLGGKARGLFQGTICVAPGAQKTDGAQQSRTLLLSDQARMDARPALEINADDVQCAHGSAIGALDEDSLFYMRTRGIAEDEARKLLIHAFVNEALDTISMPPIRAVAEAVLQGAFDD